MRTSLLALLATGAAALLLATPSLAADLAIPAVAAVPESDAYDWTGVYVGANVQYTAGHVAASYSDPTFSVFSLDSDPAGWAGGVTAGVNQQLAGNIVIGVEGDIDYGNVGDTIDDTFATFRGRDGNTISSTTDWSGTVRGRVGFAIDRVLPYLTAGLAVANATVSSSDGPLSQSATLAGWTAGAGVEVALDDKWTAKGEVLYTDLGTHTWFPGEVYESTSHTTSTSVRAGVNYRF